MLTDGYYKMRFSHMDTAIVNSFTHHGSHVFSLLSHSTSINLKDYVYEDVVDRGFTIVFPAKTQLGYSNMDGVLLHLGKHLTMQVDRGLAIFFESELGTADTTESCTKVIIKLKQEKK